MRGVVYTISHVEGKEASQRALMIYYKQHPNTKKFMMFIYLICNFSKCSVSGDNKSFGMPANPIALDRIPGGSSSGSAVAVAAGLVDFALGEDIEILCKN